jgi:hypothetical protein
MIDISFNKIELNIIKECLSKCTDKNGSLDTIQEKIDCALEKDSKLEPLLRRKHELMIKRHENNITSEENDELMKLMEEVDEVIYTGVMTHDELGISFTAAMHAIYKDFKVNAKPLTQAEINERNKTAQKILDELMKNPKHVHLRINEDEYNEMICRFMAVEGNLNTFINSLGLVVGRTAADADMRTLHKLIDQLKVNKIR